MKILRKLLFFFSIIYGIITNIRNFLYDKAILKSFCFDVPIIAVGNLSVGGTGKTPQIEYLIRLLSNQYKVATLSRGYKRKSKGFVLADENSNAEILGDEPFQFYQKFPKIKVAVDTDRRNGIIQLLTLNDKPDIILLDDAYQHRKVKAGFYIMLSSYDDLFFKDYMLPTGNLREYRSGAKRADMIIITKCPTTISELAMSKIKRKVLRYAKYNTPIFFTYIGYDDLLFGEHTTLDLKKTLKESVLAVAGIAKPQPFFKYLNTCASASMEFPDHHLFSQKDISSILEKAQGRKIITTEKDYMRLKGKLPKEQLYYLPIKSLFNNENKLFESEILNYVGKSARNR
ncbi:tetraacyldisaccharide 4'-kinase [Flavobacterium davisii]|uniref:tetraacyldisaccharide 4'-kinase n=1 Tax=Flavobacterium davisii TaxID=2906077 RepID=UPI0035D0E182